MLLIFNSKPQVQYCQNAEQNGSSGATRFPSIRPSVPVQRAIIGNGPCTPDVNGRIAEVFLLPPSYVRCSWLMQGFASLGGL